MTNNNTEEFTKAFIELGKRFYPDQVFNESHISQAYEYGLQAIEQYDSQQPKKTAEELWEEYKLRVVFEKGIVFLMFKEQFLKAMASQQPDSREPNKAMTALIKASTETNTTEELIKHGQN